ncbi:MAG: class I SAM-dependent methyltransferase [Promethearchaeota archaeon]|jgi:ubiquinone/menaquinone biosynthesis C-methylase UbiE
MDLTIAEKQFLVILRSIKKSPKDHVTGEDIVAKLENIKKRGMIYFYEKINPLTFEDKTIQSLLEKKLMEQQDTIFQLTTKGETIVTQVRKELLDIDRSDIYKWLNSSEVLARISLEAYGKDLGQFSMMTMPQLNKLLEVLQLTPEDTVIDLGCGIGKITDYIFEVTQCTIIGIDIASEAIKLAQERTVDKKDKLMFQVDDMDDLSISPSSADCFISVDSLYFAEDLENTIKQMKTILKPKGRMGIFYSQSCSPKESLEKLQPDKTNLALALQKNGLKFETFDFSDDEKDYWNKVKDLYIKYKVDFEKEGSIDLQKSLYQDAEYQAKLYQEGRMSRHLYLVID